MRCDERVSCPPRVAVCRWQPVATTTGDITAATATLDAAYTAEQPSPSIPPVRGTHQCGEGGGMNTGMDGAHHAVNRSQQPVGLGWDGRCGASITVAKESYDGRQRRFGRRADVVSPAVATIALGFIQRQIRRLAQLLAVASMIGIDRYTDTGAGLHLCLLERD